MIRLLFYGLIILLIVRLINSSFRGTSRQPENDVVDRQKTKPKKVKKDVGEYVDYEEIKSKK